MKMMNELVYLEEVKMVEFRTYHHLNSFCEMNFVVLSLVQDFQQSFLLM